MAAPGAWTFKPHDGTQRPLLGPRPRLGLLDVAILLWREVWVMLAVFLVILALGVLAALTLKTTYPASSSVLVRLGQEYVYEPRAGDAARGAVPDSDQMIQSEVEILGSPGLKQRVIERLGLARIYPAMAKQYAAAAPSEKRKIMGSAVHAIEQHLKITTAPDTPVIRLTFEHTDPATGALVLNTLLEEYLLHRRSVLSDGDSPALEQQRQAFTQRLASADAAYADFLANNRIGDFAAEKASLSQLQAQIEQQKYQTQATLQDRLGRVGALGGQMAQVSPEVGLYRDISTAAADKLTSLKVQREDLLARYKPDARPVQELDAQIAQLERGISEGRTKGDGARRIGVNPVYQTLQTDKIQMTAEVAALRQSLATLDSQLQQLTERQIRLASLEPRFQELALDRDVLQASVRDFAVKEEQSRAAQEIAARSNDNIRIVERAVPATKGKSLKRPAVLLAFVFAAFTALCVGLVRMFMRPGLPTPQAAARSLDLPVLGTAGMKAY